MSGETLPDIRSLNREELERFITGLGEKKFRAGQVYDWLWKHHAGSFEAMTNLPKETRAILELNFTYHTAKPESRQLSSDGTVKALFRLHDGQAVEGVLIPSGKRATVCISSQAGCAMGCRFCATGMMGFRRNLTAGEIVDQVTALRDLGFPDRSAGHGISNIVFMGMGEPFLNYEQVTRAVDRITSDEGLGMSPQRITVSSVGIPKMIRRMADDGARYHFALSLHAATDLKRNRIIPFNLNHPIAELSEALAYYHKKTGNRLTIEYILFGGFNDTASDAGDLARFCKSFPVKVNLIAYNPVEGAGFLKPAPERVKAFADFLAARNMVVNIRESRGQDIAAACGQLAGKEGHGPERTVS